MVFLEESSLARQHVTRHREAAQLMNRPSLSTRESFPPSKGAVLWCLRPLFGREACESRLKFP
eukprot:4072233-Amphidinium_carterae.1